MKIVLVTLSNHLYSASRELLVQSALLHGIENVFDFDFEDIKQTQFYTQNYNILSNEQFMGYWLWKPYIILDTIKKLSEDDILIYVDAGVKITDRLDALINICSKESDIVVCGYANDANSSWTKRDCFVLMKCDEERFWYSPHCDASFMMFKKSELSTTFLKQWLEFGCNENIITNLPNINGLPNLPGYVDHRYDQSILSVLIEKFKLPLYRVPSQFGNHYKIQSFRVDGETNCINQVNQNQVNYYHTIPYYNSHYGQLTYHHRTKNFLPFEAANSKINRVNNNLISRVRMFFKRK